MKRCSILLSKRERVYAIESEKQREREGTKKKGQTSMQPTKSAPHFWLLCMAQTTVRDMVCWLVCVDDVLYLHLFVLLFFILGIQRVNECICPLGHFIFHPFPLFFSCQTALLVYVFFVLPLPQPTKPPLSPFFLFLFVFFIEYVTRPFTFISSWRMNGRREKYGALAVARAAA